MDKHLAYATTVHKKTRTNFFYQWCLLTPPNNRNLYHSSKVLQTFSVASPHIPILMFPFRLCLSCVSVCVFVFWPSRRKRFPPPRQVLSFCARMLSSSSSNSHAARSGSNALVSRHADKASRKAGQVMLRGAKYTAQSDPSTRIKVETSTNFVKSSSSHCSILNSPPHLFPRDAACSDERGSPSQQRTQREFGCDRLRCTGRRLGRRILDRQHRLK